jgi:hypothetical protein
MDGEDGADGDGAVNATLGMTTPARPSACPPYRTQCLESTVFCDR